MVLRTLSTQYYFTSVPLNGKVVREWNCVYNINTFNHNTIAAYLKRYGGECNYKGYTWRYKK